MNHGINRIEVFVCPVDFRKVLGTLATISAAIFSFEKCERVN
jgi:hypothetical protein